MAGRIGPEYRRLIDQIRASIASGEYPIGETIPSTAALAEATGVSTQVVRRAVGQLEADGILEGHPGKGVFVRAMPEDADRERQDVASLGRQVSEMGERLRELAGWSPAAPGGELDQIKADVTDLRETAGRLEVNLIDLYGKMGYDYPQGGAQQNTKTAGRRGQAR
jgi:DNA-binding transcriptional regulator YhcF (GntR family)